jgi:hypothetical protein
MNIRLARAIFLFLLAMSLAFALRETLMVLGLCKSGQDARCPRSVEADSPSSPPPAEKATARENQAGKASDRLVQIRRMRAKLSRRILDLVNGRCRLFCPGD